MTKTIDENSAAVVSHLEIMQGVIQRMATNSSSCKAWCITLVSAILVIVADKGNPNYALIAVIPTVLFLVLDSYYLALEKRFRNSYNTFIKKLHESEIGTEDLYAVKPEGGPVKAFCESLFSFSILPFYLTLFLTVLMTKYFLLKPN